MKFGKKSRTGLLSLGAFVVASFSLSGTLLAQAGQPGAPSVPPAKPATPPAEVKPSEPLPKAEEILDRYVEVTGGKAAYEKVTTVSVDGTLEMGMGLKGKVKFIVARPAKLLNEMSIDGIGEFKSGCNGTTAWASDLIQGPRLLEGPEREQALESTRIGQEGQWREHYSKVQTVALEDVKGKPAHKVELTTKEGSTRFAFYDKESGLLVKQAQKISSPQGELASESYPSEYKKVGDLLMPHKLTNVLGPQEFVIVLNKIELNPEVKPGAFDLPADIKEIVDAKKNEKPADKPAEKKEEKKEEKK